MTKDDAIAILQGVARYLMSGNEILYSDKLMLALDVAIEALEVQKVKYTFGNDGFSLENAYHDCKLVFDGITDDVSFQKADTGLILYYANEIIYALHKALKEVKNQNEELNNSNESSLTQKALDTISRQAAIDALCSECQGQCIPCESYPCSEVETINALPSAQPEIIRCKDCKHVEMARSEEAARKFGQIYICGRDVFLSPKPDDYCSWAERRTDG